MDIEKAENIHTAIEEYREDQGPTAKAEPVFRAYAAGQHEEVITPEERSRLGDRANRVIMDNVIGQCLEQIAGRLLFRQYLVENGTSEEAYLKTFARKNQLDRLIVGQTVRTLTDGSGAMSVRWSSEAKRAIVHQESWWNGEYGIFVAYNRDNAVDWAVSDWYDSDRKKNRRTVYLPHLIRRYIKDEGGSWTEFDKPIEWVKADSKTPIGVPVAHFPNGISPFGPYPASTVGAVIGMQDSLNATMFDIASASAMNGFPIYTAAGVAQGSKMEVGPGQAWLSENDKARFGVLSPPPLTALIDHKNDLRAGIAAHFPVPSYRIGGGDWPSGLALQRADSPMIAKVKLLGDLFAPGLVLIGHRAIEMENAFNRGTLNEDNIVTVEWAPPDQVDPGTQRELDQAQADVYETIERLTPTMMAKTGLVSTTEITKIKRELKERMGTLADIDGGGNDEERQAS